MSVLAPLLFALLVSTDALPANSVAAQALAEGDAHYARRSEGIRDGIASPAQVDLAIANYRRALNLAPDSYEVRLRLLRAMFFRGGFCGMGDREQIPLFVEAKRLADDTVRRLEASIKAPRAQARREVLRREPLAAEIYLWAAISWGQWAVDHKIAAAWQGAAVQIRDLSQAVIDIAPETLQGGGYLIQGRLHAEAPRIPMLTHWVSRRRGLECLRQAVALAPDNTAANYFLADAILDLQPSQKGEAVALLQKVATTSPRPDYVAEDLHYAAMARDRLRDLSPRAAD